MRSNEAVAEQVLRAWQRARRGANPDRAFLSRVAAIIAADRRHLLDLVEAAVDGGRARAGERATARRRRALESHAAAGGSR